MTQNSIDALKILRSTENMQWYIVPILIFIIYVYVTEAQNKNWSAFYLGIATFGFELIWEMFNASILHFTNYAPLWSAPGQTAYLIYTGLNIEIVSLFAIAGVLLVKSLPEDKNLKLFGISNRIVIPIAWGLICVLVETILYKAGLLKWDYSWWRWPNIGLISLVYIAPWFIVTWAHDNLSMQHKKIGALVAIPLAAAFHLICAVILKWI